MRRDCNNNRLVHQALRGLRFLFPFLWSSLRAAEVEIVVVEVEAEVVAVAEVVVAAAASALVVVEGSS